MNSEKMRKLIEDCRRDLADYLSPANGISDREVVIALLHRLEGPQGIDALEEDFGWRSLPDNSHTVERALSPWNEGRLRLIFRQARKCL